MSNLKIEILSLNNLKRIESLTDEEMSIKGRGDIDIDIDGSADFEDATIAAYDLPPDYYEHLLKILQAQS